MRWLLLILAFIAVGLWICIAGPASLRWRYRTDVDRALAHSPVGDPGTITAEEIARLPEPVQKYLRLSGIDAGSPRVRNVYARMHGRIRSTADAPWLTFTAEQLDDFSTRSRFFYMDAAKGGLPVQGFHRYVAGSASMHVELAGLIPVVAADGEAMTIAETVTLLNDMAVLAPATLVDPAIHWTPVDPCSARAVFTHAGHTIQATLEFDDAGRLVNFWSDDRGQWKPDRTMRMMRWSTPLSDYRPFGALRLAGRGEGRWHDAAGPFTYIEIEMDDLRVNVSRRPR